MADKVQEYLISYYDSPPFSSVAACSKNDICPLNKSCLRAIVFNQQGWFGSWIDPKDTGLNCRLIITDKKKEEPKVETKPKFKIRG